MKTDTAYNHLTRLKSRIDSIYSSGMSYRATYTHILGLLEKQIWEDEALEKCPSWVRDSLVNHSIAKLDEIHRHFTIWAFMCPDGKPRIWEQMDEATLQNYCQPGKTGNRFWLKLTNSNSHWGVVTEQTFTQVWEITSDIFI